MGNPSKRQPKPPSIKDVAELAGVSWSTVSNVVRNAPNVRPETKHRVDEAIRALGYRTNTAGRQLRGGRSETVLVAVPDLTNPFHSLLVEKIADELSDHGLSLFLELTRSERETEKRILEGRFRQAVDGVLLMPRVLSGLEISRLTPQFPVVLLAETVGGSGLDLACADGRTMTAQMVDFLVSHGHRRIAFVGHIASGSNDSRGRLTTSFVNSLRSHNLEVGSGLIFSLPEWTIESGSRAAQSIAEHRHEIDAVVCADELVAIGIIRRLAELGVRIPEDLSVAGLQGFASPQFGNQSITSVSINVEQQAQLAVETLIRRIEGDKSPALCVSVEHHLRLGQSTLPRINEPEYPI